MSLINEYRITEQAIKDLQARLTNLQQDGRMKAELEFDTKLRALMSEYNKSLRDVINLLDPQAQNRSSKTQPTSGRRERQLKRYLNPNTNEVVETKGGNHKILKEWKTQFGADVVESWLQS
ncbi:TPA: histone-like nucleoid-structuring protein, MvaT/MvaU family [Pseudomonas aeruginosa]|uniref:histone-like nucleoid-structuring protein, MvaT/MvaU family n=1 Tax=Pseudomonas aeruginosa TaxID=287 RepID=UPI00222FED43|nr:histone-like nucleoid-structuring protein, MvaT/MvaU family [Pseudomonas aeruginosa]MCW3860123.1 DNA binding protein [Pseudomonas aeruginosa]MCW3872096.1 DNA binding protein [Pseudomonas aeruginosa]MCW3891572.1 DNA binding protein [Pseudomonas aeruginosa]MCW3943196.1 DNA binding protein [Pseudomonas aeruginosa]MCW3950226.1 DNA binding protein [Pseudomonas aeruginosa]